MLERLVTIGSLISTILAIVLICATTPTSIGPLGIFIIFVLVYVSVLGVLTYLLFGLSKVFIWLTGLMGIKQKMNVLTFRRAYYFSSVLTLVPIMLIGLHSVGEVGVYEVFLVMIFAVIGCLYIAKRTS